ncbi:eyes absent homolog 3 [Ornithorhynchus anatinus]|uniref:Eyes absent homolog n=1 Tax=Ornithorhynchus anatinus TaxID=9258 RepID=F7DYI0_ORNAN|nr:eyes absent homolog 3 [Ornithorhynchus anatinus]
MEEDRDLTEQQPTVKKAKMQESGEPALSQGTLPDANEQKVEGPGLASDVTMADGILTCTDYLPRPASDYSSQLYSAKPYTHILSVPVSETLTAYSGQTQYQALPQSQPYTVYPQAAQSYGLPPFAPSPNASLVSASSTATAAANVSAVASISSQDYPTYTILGQNQYQTCYPSPSFSLPAQTSSSSSAETAPLAAPVYQAGKPGGIAPTPANQRLSSGDPAASPSLARAAPSKEAEEQARKNVAGKNRGKRKADATASQDNELERVFLWDLDETIIIFHSLLTGSYAQKYGKDPTVVIGSGLTMEEMIFEVADTHLFFNDLEECDQVHVEDVASDDNGQDLSNYSFSTDGFSGSAGGTGPGGAVGVQGGVDWMRKLAFRYRKVRETYDKHKSNVGGLLSPQRKEALQRLRAEIEVLTDSWLGTALKSLLLIQSRKNCVNILITTTQLVPALAKVLLYGLGEVFPIENIYSATKIGKESCFERIVSRFGKKVTYVVIGDGRDEEIAAKQHNMPFWRVTNHSDLVSLHQALELDFL